MPGALRSRAAGAGTTLLVHAGIGWLLWAGLGTPARTAPQPLAVRFVQVAPPAPVAAAPQPQEQRVEAPAKIEPAPVKPPPPPKPEPRVERKPPPPKPERARKRVVREPRIVQQVERSEPVEPSRPVAAPPLPAPAPVAEAAEPVSPLEHAAAPATSPVAETSRSPAPADPAPAASAALPNTVASAAPVGPPAAVPITLPRSDAAYLRNPAPVYPSIARRMREQGLVVLRVFVQPDGRPSEVAVGTSSGFRRLDSAALDAVRSWTFVPARRGKEPVAAWVLVPVHFRLNNG